MGQKLTSNTVTKSVTITREELRKLVDDLNVRFRNSFADDSLPLHFAVSGDDNESVFWRAQVQIRCYTLKPGADGRIVTRLSKVYNLSQFLSAYRSFNQLLEAAEASSSNQADFDKEAFMTASIFYDSANDEGQCVICFERIPDTVLPCAHAYCAQCTESMRAITECPLCRSRLSKSIVDDSWVVPDKPQKSSVTAYLTESATAGTSSDVTPR